MQCNKFIQLLVFGVISLACIQRYICKFVYLLHSVINEGVVERTIKFMKREMMLHKKVVKVIRLPLWIHTVLQFLFSLLSLTLSPFGFQWWLCKTLFTILSRLVYAIYVFIISAFHASLSKYMYKGYLDIRYHESIMNILIIELNDLVANNKKKKNIMEIHPQFVTIPRQWSTDSIFYSMSKYTEINDPLVLDGLKYIESAGICTLKELCTKFTTITNYISTTAKQFISESEYQHFVDVISVSRNLCCVIIKREVPKELDGDAYLTILQKVVVDSATVSDYLNNDPRVQNLKRIITEGRWDATFKMSRLTTDLENMNVTNKQYFRYPEDIKLYAHCLYNYLGKSKYQMILGVPESKQFKSQKKKKREIMILVELMIFYLLPVYWSNNDRG
jgi:hypothetical protein